MQRYKFHPRVTATFNYTNNTVRIYDQGQYRLPQAIVIMADTVRTMGITEDDFSCCDEQAEYFEFKFNDPSALVAIKLCFDIRS